MIKFETINGTLCRMVEPEPLTTDAKLPCLVRLIQDDSRMGMFNRDTKPNRLSDFYLAARIVNNNIVVNEFMESDYHRFEIIGYPVEEGSRWWALYKMMQGKKVSYKGAIGNVYWALNQDGNVQYYDMDNLAYIGTIRSKLEFGKKDVVKTGWQLYKEPKPEPAKEQFEVGDWVEFIDVGGRKSQGKYLSNTDGNAIIVLDTTCNMRCVVHTTKIIRKLFPSEVVVHIGCLSGTVSFADADRFILRGIGNSEMANACIMFKMLDAATCVLVESLLKAQDEDK